MSNLLKNNAYHILGLDTSASQKDINKRAKDLAKFIQIDELPQYDLDLGIFENFRTEDSVKDALQRLTSPKKQIKEYFLWFNINDDIDEQAIYILSKKDFEGAVKVWEHHSQGDSAKAIFYKKNLAILYCLLMFKQNSGYYLTASLKIWQELVNSAKFWSAFSKVYKLNDELNTNQETIDDFQKNCISYISDLYTEITEAREDNKYVAEFSNIFKTRGGKTLKNLLIPIFSEMTVATEHIESLKIDDKGSFDKTKRTILKENIAILQNCCNKFIDLGLFEDSQVKVIRDRAAQAIRRISIDLHNDLDEKEMALSLLEIADVISGMTGLKNNIEKDRETIKNNIEHERKNPVNSCWYCKKAIKDQTSSISEKIHKVTNVERVFRGTRTHYQTYELTIPRCADCALAHKKISNNYLKIGGAVGGGVGIIAAASFGWGAVGYIIGIIVGVLLGLTISDEVAKGKGSDDVKPVKYKKEFPPYQELLANGWKPGGSPS